MDFDDGDLKDIWDTDLDANLQDTLKMSNYPDIQDWMDPNSKLPPVILNDKLMTDAIIGTCMPIKTEHSYSLNSDGDSLPDTIPDSPHSLQNKMDDMDEECYPAISMNGSSKHQHIIHRQNHTNSLLANGQTRDSKPTFAGMSLLANGGLSNAASAGQQQSAQIAANGGGFLTSNGSLISSNNNNNHLAVNHNLNLKESIAGLKGLAGFGSSSSCHDSSSSTSASIASDIDIDETTVKEEPLSPSSSCPPSPIGSGCGGGGGSSEGGGGSLHNSFGVSAVSLGAYAHSDLVLEHKNGSLQLASATQSLLKNQQIMIATSIPQQSSTTQQQQKLVMSKLNIKMEPQSSGFGLPPTPPSSLPSDESEGNQSPEHHVSPMSPPTDIGSTSSGANSTTSSRRTSLHASSTSSGAGSQIGSTAGGQSATTTSRQASGASHHSSAGSSPSASQSTTSSTRQPIHTPLISSQPKGSTGTLILTEEEKRTLLAEGYPIPTRLPLTKAEEKSLKKIRRKIKNKISAQESRRKKKEYMDQLERRVEILMSENLDYRKRVETLEDCNQNLQTELSKLRQLITRQGARKAS
ncbi:cyclic AMP response element-binding protein A isoform X2 [Anopheles stephensi]|uniref:cyclic AMP response element-binding protein A isoform X2 n=1 Tax=Anopheles stephensi TaxID=30069 RepID=UPI00165886D0|nr:cyclic AMP response element-binding protein A isoform X2 [Anopheles stephensi]